MNINAQNFWNGFREEFDAHDHVTYDNLKLYLAAVNADPIWRDAPTPAEVRRLAYLTATAYHESGHRFEPRNEIRASPKRQPALWRTQERYWPSGYFGRGLVMLTWEANYRKASNLCGIDFVRQPELVKQYPHCYTILTLGSLAGMFTGHALSDYLNDSKTDLIGARMVINGRDCAALIAGHAAKFENIIRSTMGAL
jgi:hypothetical protein